MLLLQFKDCVSVQKFARTDRDGRRAQWFTPPTSEATLRNGVHITQVPALVEVRLIPVDLEEVVHARGLLLAAERAILAQLQHAEGRIRGRLAAELFTVRKMLGEAQRSFSQAGQDLFLDDNVFRGRTGGVFVEAGACDGVQTSNTLFFEMFRGWTGLLIEPIPHLAEAARFARRSPCVTAALDDHEGSSAFLHILEGYTRSSGLVSTITGQTRDYIRTHPQHREELIEVPVRPLHEILADAGMRRIDYLSLDIEGAEERVLNAFPFADIDVLVWTVENNHRGQEIENIMKQRGYVLAEYIWVDEVYIREDFFAEIAAD